LAVRKAYLVLKSKITKNKSALRALLLKFKLITI